MDVLVIPASFPLDYMQDGIFVGLYSSVDVLDAEHLRHRNMHNQNLARILTQKPRGLNITSLAGRDYKAERRDRFVCRTCVVSIVTASYSLSGCKISVNTTS
jgi:hypothetical protein